jgi:hypothetical protein
VAVLCLAVLPAAVWPGPGRWLAASAQQRGAGRWRTGVVLERREGQLGRSRRAAEQEALSSKLAAALERSCAGVRPRDTRQERRLEAGARVGGLPD